MATKNDKYIRVEKEKQKNEQAPENEIRVTALKGMRNYITYGISLFTNKEKSFDQIHLKAMGRAINKTVTIAEILKRRVENLHQNTNLESTEIVDKYEPLEEGLDVVEIKRRVSSITITLSKTPLDTSSPGYQAPIPQDLVKPEDKGQGRPYEPRRGGYPSRRFNPRGRGGRGYRRNYGGYQQGGHQQGERQQGGYQQGERYQGERYQGERPVGNFRRGRGNYYQGNQGGGYQGNQGGGYQGNQGGYQGGQGGGYQQGGFRRGRGGRGRGGFQNRNYRGGFQNRSYRGGYNNRRGRGDGNQQN